MFSTINPLVPSPPGQALESMHDLEAHGRATPYHRGNDKTIYEEGY
jgi:hypothetical protein